MLVTMPKPTRSNRTSRDLRSLLHVPQNDLQAQVATRLEAIGFPTLRPAHVQILSAVGPDGCRLAMKVNAPVTDDKTTANYYS